MNKLHIELKNKINGIFKNNIPFDPIIYYKNVKLLNNTLTSNFDAVWSINIKSFQNHHIFKDAKIMLYVTLNKTILSSDINGDCWEDLYKTADKLITLSENLNYIFIEDFIVINHNTIRLITGS